MKHPLYLVPTVFLLIGSVACTGASGDERRLNDNGSGSNNGSGSGGDNGGLGPGTPGNPGPGIPPGGSKECGSVLPVTYRDFRGQGEAGGHADFELSKHPSKKHNGEDYMGWNDIGCGMVEETIGPDRKPVLFTGQADTGTTGIQVPVGSGRQQRVVTGPDCWSESNQNPDPAGTCYVGTCQTWAITPPTFGEIESTTTFNQWYNDVPGVNITIEGELPLTETSPGSGVYVFESAEFFPLDDVAESWGLTQGEAHNYHFTTEIHVRFKYEEGQMFTFRGDDDLWIFVNGKLALDVGGLHQALTGTIDFDAQREKLGIVPGESYDMDIFHAERQTSASNFRIETNISCFEPIIR